MLISTLIAGLALAGQAPAPAQPAQAQKVTDDARGAFEIELDSQGRVVRAQSRNAILSDVAKQLGTLLKVPVKVSNALGRTRVSFSKIEGVPLNEVLARLAPAPFVETRETWGKAPQLIGVNLVESSQAAPPATQPAGIVIEATIPDPEDEVGVAGSTAKAATPPSGEAPPPEEGPFLRVRRLSDGRLSVDARDQGLGVLLFEVAQACGVRFDMRIPEAPLVSRISVDGIWPSELPGVLALPGVGVDVRRNLLTGEETALRYFVEAAS